MHFVAFDFCSLPSPLSCRRARHLQRLAPATVPLSRFVELTPIYQLATKNGFGER